MQEEFSCSDGTCISKDYVCELVLDYIHAEETHRGPFERQSSHWCLYTHITELYLVCWRLISEFELEVEITEVELPHHLPAGHTGVYLLHLCYFSRWVLEEFVHPVKTNHKADI